MQCTLHLAISTHYCHHNNYYAIRVVKSEACEFKDTKDKLLYKLANSSIIKPCVSPHHDLLIILFSL